MHAAAHPLVQAHAVCKRYGDGPLVLEGVSFDVSTGEFISILGPSGCGKTTLLRLLAGLNPISGGSLEIDGVPPESASHEVACVFQDATLLPWLTVASNADLFLKLSGTPHHERSERVRHALDLVGLSNHAEAYPWQLSGGQKMRVSLARALTIAPKLLLLDEPFGALDEMTRERLNEELLSIRGKQAWTAFFVTHSVAEAVFLSSRIFVLSSNPGRIAATIEVPLPHPRTADTRESEGYLRLVAEVSHRLRNLK